MAETRFECGGECSLVARGDPEAGGVCGQNLKSSVAISRRHFQTKSRGPHLQKHGKLKNARRSRRQIAIGLAKLTKKWINSAHDFLDMVRVSLSFGMDKRCRYAVSNTRLVPIAFLGIYPGDTIYRPSSQPG
jgi:hypothetical protein